MVAEDEFEIELPDKKQVGLTKLVEQVASERGLDAPDVIRLRATSLAHVYMDRDGQSVLVIGGTLIAILPQRALAGVIAHELSHLTAGDVRRSRTARRRDPCRSAREDEVDPYFSERGERLRRDRRHRNLGRRTEHQSGRQPERECGRCCLSVCGL